MKLCARFLTSTVYLFTNLSVCMFEKLLSESNCGPHWDQWNQLNETNPQLVGGDKLALVIIHCPKPLLDVGLGGEGKETWENNDMVFSLFFMWIEMKSISSLDALEVFMLTTPSAAMDENIIKVVIFPFHDTVWNVSKWKQRLPVQ